MRICTGSSRRVLLVGTHAIKFARLGFVRTPKHLWWCVFDRDFARTKYKTQYRRHSFFRSVLAYLWAQLTLGVLANRQEYRLYRTHPELPIAKIHAIYLGGLILVMERGEPAPAEISKNLRTRYPSGDLEQEKHVCLFDGVPLYVDYGHQDAPRIFGVS